MQVSLPRHAKMGLAFMAMRETLGGPCGGICADEPGLGQIESLLGLTLNHNHSLHSCTSVLAAHSPGAGADEVSCFPCVQFRGLLLCQGVLVDATAAGVWWSLTCPCAPST